LFDQDGGSGRESAAVKARSVGFGLCVSIIGLCGAMPGLAQVVANGNDPLTQLSRMSLEELANVEVTSVSKTAQSLGSAPASIYVITREEILRHGVLSIAEALRLAPNLQITQLTASDYSNGARGFAGAPDVQNFSNKILILIDGRSVYSPLFSGVGYDMQDVLLDDIDRIEVISGPGATLWGANATNGVINIITRKAGETRGALLRMDGGSEEQDVGARYGGSLGEQGAFRVYGKWFDRGSTELADGSSAGDDWSKLQAGFRIDTQSGANSFTVQGDYQHAEESFASSGDVPFSGSNLLGRWEYAGQRVATRVQAFFDRVDRGRPPDGIAYDIDTYDVELQQSAQLGGRHRLVWGLGRRYNDYHTQNNNLAFIPEHRRLELSNVFVQDNVTLSRTFELSAGVKFEDNSYSGWSALPDLRLSWNPTEHNLFWLAGSRAIRSPTPFDADVQEFVGGQLFLRGDPDFKPEKVTAYEIGYRGQPDATVSLSVSMFYDEWDDLRTVEVTPVTLLPLVWGNLMEGNSYGTEAWVTLQLTPWWRISPGFRSLHKRLHFSDGASQLIGVSQAGNDPTARYLFKSSMDFGRLSVDAMLREVDSLPDPATPGYTELSARFAWQFGEHLQFAIKGFNLLNETHREYADPNGRQIRRSILAELRLAQ
jgi:iron complex outermembrane receptor protein